MRSAAARCCAARQSAVALHQATGRYLFSVPPGLPEFPVLTNQVKAAYGASQAAFARTADARARGEKRDKLKLLGVEWARQTFGLELADGDDGISDALAVAVAAWRIWRREEADARAKAQQRPLFGPGSRGPRKARQAE